jgi:hypothetical protein
MEVTLEIISNLGLIVLLAVVARVLYICFAFWWYRQEPFSVSSEAFEEVPGGPEIRSLSHGVAFVPATAASKVGLVYLQGALVHSHAYAPLCREISERTGCAVVLMELPLRIAMLGHSRITTAMSQVPEVSRWAIGGHSLGGPAGAKFILDFAKPTAQLLPKGSSMVGLLLHAAYIGAGDGRNIRLSDRDDISALQILGDKDAIVTGENIGVGKAALPPDAVSESVAGCNHSGFGHYGPQVFPRRDGEATTSKEELQHAIAELTATWLNGLSI